jgi:hypothetical protein
MSRQCLNELVYHKGDGLTPVSVTNQERFLKSLSHI